MIQWRLEAPTQVLGRRLHRLDTNNAKRRNKKKMMNWKKHLKAATVMSMLLLGMTVAASAQNSNQANVSMSATLQESITVSLSGANVNFTLASGNASNPGDTTIDATTDWVLKPGRTKLELDAYFDSSSAALVHQGTYPGGQTPIDIPSSAVEVSMTSVLGNFPLTPVSNSVAFGAAGAGLQLFNQTINGANKTGSRTVTLGFNINLGSLTQLPADTYNGTLRIQAQATP